MSPVQRIKIYLARVRRRLLLVRAVNDTSVSLAAAAFAVLLVLLIAPATDNPTAVRPLVLLMVAAALFIAVARIGTSAVKLRQDTAVARLVGAHDAALRSDLLSTVELPTDRSARFSASLFSALAQQTWAHLASLKPDALVSLDRLRVGAVALAIAILSWAGAAVWGPNQLRRGSAIFLRGPTPAPARVATERLIRDLTVDYAYPAYMRRKGRHVTNTTGHISAPAGTRVTLNATAVVPIRSAAIAMRAETSDTIRDVPVAIPRDRRLSATLSVATAGTYHFVVRTLDGHDLNDPIDLRINVEADTSPKVALYGPPDRMEVGARERVELTYTADDDWGLSRVSLAYERDSHPVEHIQLWAANAREQQRQAIGKYEWSLEPLDLEGGSRVTYWVEAVDNDTVSGPKTTRSRQLVLRVFSPEERHDRTLALQRQLKDRALQLLAGRLLVLADGPERSSKSRNHTVEALQELHVGESRFAESLRQLLHLTSEDQSVPVQVRRAIDTMHKRLLKLVRAEQQLRDRWRKERQGARMASRAQQTVARRIDRLRPYNHHSSAELERDALLLANLLDEQQLQGLARIAQGLKRARTRIKTLLDRYRKTRDEALRRQILREISRMQRQLSKLAQQMAKLQTTIPDEYLNREAIKNLRLGQRLDAIRSMVERGEIDHIESALKDLDQQLATIQELFKSGLSSFRSERMHAREQAFGALLDQLHELEQEQIGLARTTRKLVRRYRKRGSELMRGELGPGMEQQLAKLSRLRKRLSEVQRRPLEQYQREELDRITEWSRWLKQTLDRRDLEQSLETAQRVNGGLKRLREDMREDAIGAYLPWRKRQLQILEQVGRAQAAAEEIENDLEALFPTPDTLLKPEERKQVEVMRKRQRALAQRIRRILKAANKSRDASAPQLLGPSERHELRQANQLMHDAIKKLRAIRPHQAHGAQQGAADLLAQIQRALQRARQGGINENRASYRDRVKIPDANAFVPPKAFRQDILDAMKEAPPSGYESEVERYYRELVR